MIAGLEVPHVHIHLVPINSVFDLDFRNQDQNPSPDDLDHAAETIRAELRRMGVEAGVGDESPWPRSRS